MRRMLRRSVWILAVLVCGSWGFGQTAFKHILITNDDGIEDADRLIALAQGVSPAAARVSVIVSAFDRSGTSNHSVYGKYRSTLEVTCEYRDPDRNLAVYTLPANPADCVLLGLSGFFGGDRPDLVLSGINGGPNMGPDWFGSGTIGAVRTAAFLGVKAVAFSGFDDDIKVSFTVIPKWIAALLSSGFLDGVGRHAYLTIGFPRLPPEEIKGVRLSGRRIAYDNPGMIELVKIHGREPHVPESTTIWTMRIAGDPIRRDRISDDDYLRRGFIVITPMSIDENHPVLLRKLEAKAGLIPEFLK